MRLWSKSQGMGLAAVIVGTSVLISRFMGLVRDKVISYWFGASIDSDLYFAAFVIPDFINYLLAGAYFSITLIPILSRLFQEDERDGWNFFSAALFWVFSAITILTILGEIFADQIVPYVAPGFGSNDLYRLTRFVRIILPAQICFLVGSCFSAVLYLRKQFVVPSLSPLIYNGGIIILGIFLRHHGIEGFCWGVLVGAFGGNFLLPFLAAKYGKNSSMNLSFRLWHREMKRFIVTAVPLMVGQSIVVLDEQLVRVFGSFAGSGTISHINYARRLMMVPVGIVGQAVAVASYPFMAELLAQKKMKEFFQTIREAIKNTMLIIIPLAFGMAAVAEPAVGLIFQQGKFELSDTVKTARLLQLYLTAVPLWAFQQILGRGFYVAGDTLSPVVIGTITTIIALPMFFAGSRYLGGEGVVGASVIGFLLYSVALIFWWMRRWNGKETFEGLARDFFKYIVAGGIAFVLSSKFSDLLKNFFSFGFSLFDYLITGLATGIFFCMVWFGCAMVLFKNEMFWLVSRLTKGRIGIRR
ncbi:MAG: murein biosynthesis integral membrane protein MurJ [Thermodesulforhabdaceae bacterium]